MSARVIQLPVRHGPITELEHVTRCVQEAAVSTLGCSVDPERARRMAELLIERKRRKAGGRGDEAAG